jgi:hypothetical protein
MRCVNPRLLKKPSRGFAWACGPCSKAQEKKLEARNIPNGMALFDDDDDDDDEDDDDGNTNQSFISESREGESSQIDCSELPNIPLLRLLRKDDHPHHIPLLTNDTIDGTATLNLGMLEMDSDLTADVRRELEEEDLKFTPGNGSNSLVDEFENRMRSDNTGTPLGMASHFSPPPEQPFKCDQCQRTFNRKHDLERHKRSIHEPTQLFSCGYCKKIFVRKVKLEVHSSSASP